MLALHLDRAEVHLGGEGLFLRSFAVQVQRPADVLPVHHGLVDAVVPRLDDAQREAILAGFGDRNLELDQVTRVLLAHPMHNAVAAERSGRCIVQHLLVLMAADGNADNLQLLGFDPLLGDCRQREDCEGQRNDGASCEHDLSTPPGRDAPPNMSAHRLCASIRLPCYAPNLDGNHDSLKETMLSRRESVNGSTGEREADGTMQAADSAPRLAMRMFGHFDVRIGDRSLLPFRTRTEARLLALLALKHGRWLRRDWIAAQLWPESERAGVWLMEALSRVRRALGPHGSRIRSGPHSTLTFDAADADIDLLTFDRAASESSVSGCAEAVSIYAGPLLEGFDDDWAIAERSLREERYLRCAECIAESDIDHGRAHEAVLMLIAAARCDPLRESLHALLMRAYVALGDPSAALRTFHGLRRRLMGLNLPVAGELKELAARIRKDAEAAPPSGGTPALLRRIAEPRLNGSSLPYPLTEIIGREAEIRMVAAEVERNRLVTLTGILGASGPRR